MPLQREVDQVDERSLIEAAQRDPVRFSELYELNFDRVYAFIARRVATRAEAEDLTSEVFHRALENLTRFEWRGAPFIAWLLHIASNAISDHRGRADRETPAEVSLGDPPDTRTMQEIEQQASFYQLVRQLPETQRQVIVMRFVEQRSIREIAEHLQRTEGAVKQLQLRALETLRERMEGQHGR